MNKKLILLIMFAVFSVNTYAKTTLDPLLKELDQVIADRQKYSDLKEAKIDNIKKQLKTNLSNEQQFNLYGSLFREYSNYQTDSAYQMALRRIDLAKEIGKDFEIAISQMNMAEVLRTTGMYKETLDILGKLDEEGLQRQDIQYYNHLYHSLYTLMVDYSLSDDERVKYQTLVYSYKDSILAEVPSKGFVYNIVLSNKRLEEGNYDEALKLAQAAEKMTDDVSYLQGVVDYVLADAYGHKKEVEQQKIYLTKSAIADIQSGIKEYISLQELAKILYEEGDVDRAYLYLKCAMEDAIFCNARLRTLEVSRMLPIINDTYDIKMRQEKSRLSWLLGITFVLSVILIAAVFYIYKQVKKLSSIRKYQKKTNLELKRVNSEMKDMNSRLSEANLVKEEYIGYVFNICSSYINKLEDFRVNVNRKIKTKQFDELYKTTSSSSLVDDELKEFYKNFDTIFLGLFPTFVEEFNALLAKDGQITPKDGEPLTTELRIFALIRLGITDSVKIANFLHYSPQTIYNYRFKIRNKAIVSKDEFADKIAQIGL